jgi:hypothetical protein
MRALHFMPLVLVAGIDGFALFVPYLALVGAAAVLLGRFKPRPQPVPLSS